jgi:N-acetylglucosaminyldiphosphoundecaprenol N-acetyl-beta-D-mannosaminyltransferase
VTTKGAGDPDSFRVLGVPVNVLDMPLALQTIDQFISNKRGGYICIRDVHGVMAAQVDEHLQNIHEHALLVTPDGMPLVWLGRLNGYPSIRRVCGPDLVSALCAHSIDRGYTHYFFGGTDDVLTKLMATLRFQFPGLKIAGWECPPFKTTTTTPDLAATEKMRMANPDIIWIGLGSPKQEYWMQANAANLPSAIQIGVGAAFAFHAGIVQRAPLWMQKSGLEWLFRLAQEPGRLWRRYLVMAPKFVTLATWELLKRRLYDR